MYHKLPHYKSAANLLKLAKECGVNVKHILYNEKKYQFMNIKSLFALVSETLKHWNIVEHLISESKILVNEPQLNVWLVRILITELIFGKKVVNDQNDIGHKILQYESEFRDLLSKQNVQETVGFNKNVESKVRYIKVNSIKETIDSVIKIFIDEGWQQIPTSDSYQEYLVQLSQLEPHSDFFLQDFHIPDVLVFPPGTELHSHDLYKNGVFFFMDKSSCLAPYLLHPHQDGILLDMCAAPGLKTIHLASLVQSGKVYAVERNAERFQVLNDMVKNSGATNIVTIHEDVTKLEVKQYADVEYILLDPSCSGSGMRWRQPLVSDGETSCDQRRLYKLAGFQLTLLRFALTRFPAAKKIVYSTCSLNEEENEEVVQAALNSMYHNFKIVSAGKKLSQWINFGSQKYTFGTKCIYSRPETDITNGFFVAVFKRRKTSRLPKSILNTSDDFNSHTKGDIKYSESIDCIDSKDTKRNTSLSYSDISNKYGQYDMSYSANDKHLKNSTYNKGEETLIIKNKPKQRIHNSVIDQLNDLCHGDNVKGEDKIKSYKKTSSNDVIHKSKAISGLINTSKKPLTTSKKKRLRKQKLKFKMSENSNNETNKNKKVTTVQHLNDNTKSNVNIGTNKKMLRNIINPVRVSDKISKAKLRFLRSKKLKLKSALVNASQGVTYSSMNDETKASPSSQGYKKQETHNNANSNIVAFELQYPKEEATHENTASQSNKERRKKKKIASVAETEQNNRSKDVISLKRKHKENLTKITDEDIETSLNNMKDTVFKESFTLKSPNTHIGSKNPKINKTTFKKKKIDIPASTESDCCQGIESHSETDKEKISENSVMYVEDTNNHSKKDKDKTKKRKKRSDPSIYGFEKVVNVQSNNVDLKNDPIAETLSIKKHKNK